MSYLIALFGEAEKGQYSTAYLLHTLPELVEFLGHPPPDTLGLFCAVQALLYKRDLLFFRVQEEGFSYNDYIEGLHLMEKEPKVLPITAVCLPGVGDAKIIDAMTDFCSVHHSVMITREADLFDYLTNL